MSRAALARAIAEAVLAVPGVVEMASVGAVEVATQFAGGKISGLRLSGPEVEIHIVIDQLPAQEVAARVRAAAAGVLLAIGDDRPIAVVISDIVADTLPTDRQG